MIRLHTGLRAVLASLLALCCDQSTVDSPFVSDHAAGDAGDAPTPGRDAGPDAGALLGKPCLDDGQCDDGLDCTFDECVPGVQRCRAAPDDSQCADDVYCNGIEKCDVLLGCSSGVPITCSDGTPCTLDRCVEEEKSCRHDPRDVDEDGDVDRLCEGEGDCNDTDPTISSLHSEICSNGQDDNCDAVVDEADCEAPAHDTCDDPYVISGSGSFQLSGSAMGRDYAGSCLNIDTAGHDLVLALEVTSDIEQDVDIVARSDQGDLWLAAFEECGDVSSETACVLSGSALNDESVTRLRLRNPGVGLHHVVVFADAPGLIAFSVSYEEPSPRAENETCNSAAPLQASEPTLVRVADSRRDVPSICATLDGELAYGELVYSFTLDEPADVRLVATSLDGYGVPQLSLQRDTCLQAQASEVTCRRGDGALLFVRALAAGTYFVAVGATGPSDLELLLQLQEPSSAPADELCSDPPELATQRLLTVDLAEHTDDVFDGCLPGGIDAVYALDVPEPSDVLLIERFADDQIGAVNLFELACQDERLSCAVSNSSPVRAASHNLAAGEYAVVVEASLPTETTITALQRPAQAPLIVAFADTCETALEIPAVGGFFQGNTANARAHYGAGCDLPAQGEAGARDQMLKLTLEEEKRVVLDMMGSSYATLLAVREASSCPGTQVPNGCSLGVTMSRSYLDLTLPSGEYFVQVDGFAREEGAWFLDVYVVDP